MILQVLDCLARFGGVTALNGLTLELHRGEMVSLIGPNGAGKTTLFNVITGLVHPSRGAVLLEGNDISRLAPHARFHLGVARTFQTPKLSPDLLAWENVACGFRSKAGAKEACNRAQEVLSNVGLEGLSHAPTDSLSLGQRRLVEIARGIAADPLVLLLDEPVAGLDSTEIGVIPQVLQSMREEGTTATIIVEHNVEFVSRLNCRVLAMSAGELIADGSATDVLQSREVITAYLGDHGASAD